LGTIGHVPIEEYAFFIIQPLLTGLWLYRLLWSGSAHTSALPSNRARIMGSILFLALSVAGLVLLQFERSLYLALILVWSCPLLLIQWLYGGHHLWRMRKTWFWATAVPTVYLWIADRIALHLGIWHISAEHTIGFTPLGLPIEEALFFAVTNLLVVQGLLLMLYTWRVPVVLRGRNAVSG
ncbi:MAG: lycopene cyclase domain-containing protein, partial [Rhodothermales bacterium]|nr:lycopene cyclase domain-containing protein [Rhodothermales bacterium]